ncbi:type II secretion system protein [Parasalinivibrio latis]|uniref:type II secretion system protein n=1 Tax=Parasalinivibrio latis TaxID=2952610 RepID=UPI003DA503DA
MRQKGFTLIELVVVIVILGILSVTALPKFLNYSTDAKNASLSGLEGAVKSGLEMGYAKMAIAGLANLRYVSNHSDDSAQNVPAQSLPIPGCTEVGPQEICTFRWGYPDAEEYTLPKLIQNLEYSNDWKILGKRVNNIDVIVITAKSNIENNAPKDDQCYLTYFPATSERVAAKVVPTACL